MKKPMGLLNLDADREQALWRGLLAAGPQMMAASAPTVDPGGFGKGIAAAGAGFGKGVNNHLENMQTARFRNLQSEVMNQKMTMNDAAMQTAARKSAALETLAREYEAAGKTQEAGLIRAGMGEHLVKEQFKPRAQYTTVDNPFGKGGVGQRNSLTGQVVNYQAPQQPKVPAGMRVAADGTYEWIPGYLQGQAAIHSARLPQWQVDPANPGLQVSSAGERKAVPQTAAQSEVAKNQVKLAAQQGENQRAFEVFDIGMKNVQDAMDSTTTNPLVGALPAMTPEAQIAEGATATMAPVLKSMFRTAGEGTFTDKDQELLLDMVPTRTDHPEARKAKIKMIYDIVRAKLNIQGGEPALHGHGAQGGNGGTLPNVEKMPEEDLWDFFK